MLALSRRPGESIHIDGPAVIHVVQLHGGKVRLGIEAAAAVQILRTELLTRQVSGVRCELSGARRQT